MYKENMKINYCKIVQNEYVSSFIWDRVNTINKYEKNQLILIYKIMFHISNKF